MNGNHNVIIGNEKLKFPKKRRQIIIAFSADRVCVRAVFSCLMDHNDCDNYDLCHASLSNNYKLTDAADIDLICIVLTCLPYSAANTRVLAAKHKHKTETHAQCAAHVADRCILPEDSVSYLFSVRSVSRSIRFPVISY